MIPERIQVVCLAVCGALDDDVVRLASMLTRRMPVPFDLNCIVDSPRPLPISIRQIDAREWAPPREGMRATTYKLGLYDRNKIPYDEFLYLDTSLVIHRDMRPLLEFAFSRKEELVAVEDWNYDAYNTCVMRIRPGRQLAVIPHAYDLGEEYPRVVPGDQDFVTAVVRNRGLRGQVATFPEGMVASYKAARALLKKDSRGARAMLREATIVKFHGEPKMRQLLNPRYRWDQMVEKGNPWHRNAWFWIRELRREWR